MFLEEARELLQALESGLMDLEKRRDDRAHLDRTFRAAHTLKGATGMVGLSALSQFTHGVEAVLDRIRSGTLDVIPETITALLAAKDYLAGAVEDVAAGRPIATSDDLSNRLSAILAGGGPPTEPAATEPEPKGARAEVRGYRIALTPR